MTDSDFRITVTPTRDHFHFRDDSNQAETIARHVEEALDDKLTTKAAVTVDRHVEPPERFHSTPLQIEEFLRHHFAEDVLWGYQRAVGGRAVEEAARDIRSDTNLRQLEGQTGLASYGRELADLVDPIKGGGYYPSEFVSFRPKQAGQ